jgi:AraC family transcriptional regulator
VIKRTCLSASSIGLVETLECDGDRPVAEGFSPDFQIAFPYRGVFVWHVGGDDVVSDPNQVLFVRGGEAFRVSHPRAAGYAEFIVTPARQVLVDLAEAAGFALETHPLFRARSRRATPALQRRSAALLKAHGAPVDASPLELDERVLSLLRLALQLDPVRHRAPVRTRQLIRRTKEFLDATFTRRLRLDDVAQAVGASPAYLTDVFRRFEGISLQRYVTQLRLARALVDLPDVEDLSTLALDLGFSSHSHFTLAFRRAFNCTPSEWRNTLAER